LDREENKPIIGTYILSNVLRQAIEGELLGVDWEYLVAELQGDYSCAIGFFRNKTKDQDEDENDTTQTHIVAQKVLGVVNAYFQNNPDALKGPGTYAHHIFVNSAIIINAVWEIQQDKPRIFARYLFSDSVRRVVVDGRYLKKPSEPSHVYAIRSLNKDRDRHLDTIKKHRDEIRALKSQVEAKDTMRQLLATSELDEKSAVNQIANLERQVREQRKMYEGKLKGLKKENADLERKVGKFKGRAIRAEQRVEDLDQQLETMKVS
jgi:hypothetical protein